MTSISRMCILINQMMQLIYIIIYNNIYHSTIKSKLVDVKSSTYIEFSKEIDNKDPKFKIDDIVRISKRKNHFCKRLCSKLIWGSFYHKEVKNTVQWTYVISDVKG